MEPIRSVNHCSLYSRMRYCVLLVLVFCLLIGSTVPVAQADNSLLESVVEQGLQLYDALPNIHGSKVIGYNYYKTLPELWEILQRGLDVFQFRFSDAFTNMNRKQYYFSMALTLCASHKKVSWLNVEALSEVMDLDENNYTNQRLKQLMELAVDSGNPGYSEDLLEYAQGLKAIGWSLKTLKDVCDVCNQKVLLDNLDWDQMWFLATAWEASSNDELSSMGKMLLDFCDYDGSARTFSTVMKAVEKAGLSTLVDAVISQSIKAAVGATAGFIYQAFLLGVDAVTRLDVLTGTFEDMKFAAEALEACYDYVKYSKGFIDNNHDYLFNNPSELDFAFKWMMYAGINHLEACAVMNKSYSEYIDIAKNTLAANLYIDDTMIQRAQTANENALTFHERAEELREMLDTFRYVAKYGNLPEGATIEYDFSEVWVHHWEMQDKPENTLDIVRNGDGSLHASLHFDGADDYAFDFDPYDYEVVEFGDTTDLIYGSLYINAYAGGTLEVNLFSDIMSEANALYGYVSHNGLSNDYNSGWYVYTTDNPPDLFKYGGPMDYGWDGYDEGFEWIQLSEAERAQLFSELSDVRFLSASGAGAWEGRLLIDASGNFKGYYYDEDMEEISEVSFTGRFGDVWQTEETTYYLEVASTSTLHTPGTEAMTDFGGHITYAESLFPEGSAWNLTLPGTPNDQIGEDVQALIGGTLGEWDDFSEFYTLTDVSYGWGFFSFPYEWDSDAMEPMATATPVPVTPVPVTPAPVTAAPATTPPYEPQNYTIYPSNGHMRFDNGTVAFEVPTEATILPVSDQSNGSWTVSVLVPCSDALQEYLYRNNVLLGLEREIQLGLYTVSVAPVQYYEKLYGAENLDAESISKLAGNAHFRRVGYWSGTQMVASYTGDKKSAFYVRAAADETNLIPGEIKEYYVQLSQDRILCIATHDFTYDVPEGILELFLHTLEIRDPLDPQPPAASRPAAGTQPRTGDLVTFGRYEQDNDLTNGAEPIDWLVLSVRNGKALILSQYGLDCRKYHYSSGEITWENSATRAWLNSTFLETAFTAAEQAAIQITTVPNDSTQCNSKWESVGGNNTQDRIFLLSYQEAGTYFNRIYERKCLPTEYALAQGAFTDPYEKIDSKPTGIWWLRSPGRTQKDAAQVSSTGSRNGYSSVSFMDSYMIRPALWVSLDALTDHSESAPQVVTPTPQTGSRLPTPPPEYITNLPNGNVRYDDGLVSFEAPADMHIIVPFATANGNWGLTFMMAHNDELDAVIRSIYPGKAPTDILNEYLTIGKIGTGTYDTASRFYSKEIRDAETMNYTYYRNSVDMDHKKPGAETDYGTTTLAGRTAYYNWTEWNSSMLPATRREQYYIPYSDERYVLFSTDDEHNSIYRSALQLVMSTLVIYDADEAVPVITAAPTATPTVTPTATPTVSPTATPGMRAFPDIPILNQDELCVIRCGDPTTIPIPYNDTILDVGCIPVSFTNTCGQSFHLSLGYVPSSPMDLAEHDYYGRLNGDVLDAALYVTADSTFPYVSPDYNTMLLAPGETAAFYVIAFADAARYPELADYGTAKINLNVTSGTDDFWYRNYSIFYEGGYYYTEYGSEENVPGSGFLPDDGNYGYDGYNDYDDEAWLLEDALYNALYDALGDWKQTDGPVTMRVALESQTSAEYYLYIDLGGPELLELGVLGVSDTLDCLVFSDWDERVEGRLYPLDGQVLLELISKKGDSLYGYDRSDLLFERPEGFVPVWYRWYDPDWLGHWVLTDGTRTSHMYITEYDERNVSVRISFDDRYEFSGVMPMGGYFDADGFSGYLSMSSEDHSIDLWDVWVDQDYIENWMAAFDYWLIYTQVESYAVPQEQPLLIEVPEELLNLDVPITIMPVPTEPGTTVTVTNLPVTTPAPTATPAPEPTAVPVVLPIAGRSDYLQVTVARVDASSYIEGKDPTAYMPYRMIDGEETTAYQFSTKVTKLGKAYIWFEFDEPVRLDEMWMKNGFWKNSDGNDQYTRNSRVKQMTVWYRYAGSDKWQKGKDVSLKDDKTRADWKVIHLNGRDDITGIQLQITDIYKGSKFPNDVCISEIMFVQSAR